MSTKQGYKQTDTKEIPEEWAIRELGDERVTRLMKAGGTPLRTRKEYYENGTIPFVRIEDITTAGKYLNKTELKITEKGLNDSSTWLVPEKSILYSMYASYGEAVINTIPVATNQAIIAILHSENVDLEYLYYSLNQIKTSLYKYLRTTTQKNLNAEIVKNLKIPIPPLVEQQHIARILSCVDETIQKTEEVIERTEMLKRGLMQRLLTRGIGHNVFKQTELGEIPETWKLVRLGDVCTIPSGQVDPRVDPYASMLHVGPDNIEKETGFLFGMKTAKELNLKSGKYFFDGEYVLYSKIRPNLMKVAFPDFPGICSADIYPVKPNKGLLRDFLFYVLLSDRFTEYATSRSIRTGIPKINRQDFLKYRFSLPPISEQREIASILSGVQKKKMYEGKKKSVLEELKEGLMQVLLTGKVRVKVA